MPGEGHDFPHTRPPRRIAICVFGSGDATDPSNHVTRARVQKSLSLNVDRDNPGLVTVFYGYRSPSMKTSHTEALTMKDYYAEILYKEICTEVSGYEVSLYYRDDLAKTIPDSRPVSTDTTCELIVRDYLSKGYDEVCIIMSGTSMWRTRYLLYRQVKRAGLNWDIMRNRVRFISTWDTYKPYVKDKGVLKATLSWFVNFPVRELGAWAAIWFPWLKKLKNLFK